jgi:glutathione S-transferase
LGSPHALSKEVKLGLTASWKKFRSLRAMSHGLADKAYCSGAHLSLSDIAVGCALGYLDFRFPEIAWREGLSQFRQAPWQVDAAAKLH